MALQILEQIVNNVLLQVKSIPDLTRDVTHIRWVIESINKNEEGILTGGSWKSEEYLKKDTSPFSIWLDEYKENLTFNTLVEKLCKLLQRNKENMWYPLTKLLSEQVHNGLDTTKLVRFIEEALGKLPDWKIIARIRGVFPENLNIELKNNIILRSIQENDLAYETSRYSAFGSRIPSLIPHSILTLSLDEVRGRAIYDVFQKIISILTLYRVAAISYDSYSTWSNTYFQLSGGTTYSGTRYSNEPVLILRSTDVENLKEFIRNVEPYISTINVGGRPNKPVEMAFKRYSNSVTLNVALEEKILQSMMGLEALYLTGLSEARFRLSLRVSQTMSQLNEDSLLVYSNILKGYEYRSSYVHGSEINSKKHAEARLVLLEIQNYLRKSILLWLILDINSKKKKEDYLRNVDMSLINEDQKKLFVSTINEFNDLMRDNY